MNLATWQNDFRQWLLSGDADDARVFGERATLGLDIYQNNYRTQLIRCLGVSYPAITRWLGDDAFREAAIAHIETHPPRGWTLDTYGKDFEDTLSTLYPHNPDLHELAWIEWALSEAFVAPDAPAMSRDTLWQVDGEGASLGLTPSLSLRSGTLALDGEREIEFAEQDTPTITPDLHGPLPVDVQAELAHAARHPLLVVPRDPPHPPATPP